MALLSRANLGGCIVAASFLPLLGCSSGSTSKQCVSSGVASVCAAPDGGGLEYSASGLEPGSKVIFSTPVIGTNEVAVSPSGGFDGNVGLLSASGSFNGVIAVTATTAGGSTLSGDLVFE